MKRIGLILLVLACLLCAAACASADDILEYTLLEDGSGYEISGCDASAVPVMIPAEHEGLPVLSVAGKAFIHCEELREFAAEENHPVFYTEDGVLFTDQPVKTLVRFPNSFPRDYYMAPADLKAVAPWAFAGMKNVNYIHFREGLESFGDHMFDSVNWAACVYVPESLKTIGEDLLQNQKYSVAFYGPEGSTFVRYGWDHHIPCGMIMDWEPRTQTVELAEPDLADAENVPAPKETIRIPETEIRMEPYRLAVTYDFSEKQDRENTELLLDLGSEWGAFTPDGKGRVADGADPRTGLYGIGFTGAETVLRGYDRDGKLTGTRVVSGDFVFSLPGAYKVGVTGGMGTVLTIVPYQPVLTASPGTLPLDPEKFHYVAENNRIQHFVIPFTYATVSPDMPDYMSVVGFSLRDAAGNEAENSPHYAILTADFIDPYLLDRAGLIAVNLDHLNVLYETEGFTCTEASRFNLKEEFGKKLSGVLDTVKTVMSGTYYPADRGINHITVRLNGEYPMSSRSLITMDEMMAEYTQDNILSYAHEMTHAVDQRLDIQMPGAWMEGRAEYISRKACDAMKVPYWQYEDSYDWSFLSGEDRTDFFRYYTESVTRETEYPVGYYFFRYLCDTYGEDISVKIMENLFEAAGKLPDDEWNMPDDVFKKCVTDATDPDVFQNFVRDVVEK